MTNRIGVVGCGVTGSRVVGQLVALGCSSILVTDINRLKAQQLAALYRSDGVSVEVVDPEEVAQCSVVVLACAKPHVALADRLLVQGVHVVSMSDDLGDTMQLLRLDEAAKRSASTLASWCVRLLSGGNVGPRPLEARHAPTPTDYCAYVGNSARSIHFQTSDDVASTCGRRDGKCPGRGAWVEGGRSRCRDRWCRRACRSDRRSRCWVSGARDCDGWNHACGSCHSRFVGCSKQSPSCYGPAGRHSTA
ncbi:MAG: hypothetical protein EBY07_09950 [Actinobacteria bacterium]|nr:hypothetical protein [Actinomycetota bacterium]